MDDVDPHLTILLQDFVRLCQEDAPLEEQDWTALYEICLFVHEMGIQCAAPAIREFLLEHGCSSRKATFVSHQYHHFLQILKLRGDRSMSSTTPLDKSGDGSCEAAS